MWYNKQSGYSKQGLLLFLILTSVFVFFRLNPIPQDPAYHVFADQSRQFNIANGNNVISNAGFFIAGVIGLIRIRPMTRSPLVFMWRFFFSSIVLVSFGSAYYHFEPNNLTLVWDRLPMTMGFAALTSCVCFERLGNKIGYALFLPLVVLGVLSVFYWWITEQMGQGDLRPYILVQYLPMILIPLMILFFPKSSLHSQYYWFLIGCYMIAKIFELNDVTIFNITHQMISGHTLKHLAAAIGIAVFKPNLKQYQKAMC